MRWLTEGWPGGGRAGVAASVRSLSARDMKSSEMMPGSWTTQDLLLVRKRVGPGVANGIPGHLELLKDKSEGRSYLVDTGSAYSILPFSSTVQQTRQALTTSSGASIKAWGPRCVQLSASSWLFSWKFLQADVAFPIIGADFLANFKMRVVLSSMQLLCLVDLKILQETPPAGSLTAAAKGVVDTSSSPLLPTVEAISSCLHLPKWRHLEIVDPQGGNGTT